MPITPQTIVAFDFDGTITQKDTLISFLRFTHKRKFYVLMSLFLPLLVLYKAGVIRNDKAKQILFSWFYKGWSVDRFDAACSEFTPLIKHRTKAMACIAEHLKRGDTLVIVSASPEDWVRKWAQANRIEVVLATKLEVVDGRLTGRFASKNCYGQQKVARLSSEFPELNSARRSIKLIAYGDSSGDKAMLDWADESWFRYF